MHSTIEDIYTAMIETDRGVKEKVRIFDTGGLVSASSLLFQMIHTSNNTILKCLNVSIISKKSQNNLVSVTGVINHNGICCICYKI